ncbi:hypothetical protein ACQPTN_24895 [Bradyrhizobium sp. 13971]
MSDAEKKIMVWMGPESQGAFRDVTHGTLVNWHDRPIIRFSAPHARGATEYEVHLHPDDFDALAEMMFATNPDKAIRAFGAALSNGFPVSVPEAESDPVADGA